MKKKEEIVSFYLTVSFFLKMFPVARVYNHNIPGRWENHKLFMYDVTISRSVPQIMDDFRLAVEAKLYLAKDILLDGTKKAKLNTIDDLYINKEEYIERAASVVVTSHRMKNMDDYERVKYILTTKARLDEQTPKEYLADQAQLINYIANGGWRYKRLLDGDTMYIASFGESEDFPLLWFAFSVKKNRYLRLHGWVKSLLGYYLELVLKEQPSQKPGVFPFSWLIDIFQPKLLYMEALSYTVKFLANIQTEDENGVNTLRNADPECSVGEPGVLYVTKTMRDRYKQGDVNIESCILCGAMESGFFIRELGTAIRFCGECHT